MPSGWERDTRPALDCTVCDDPADRQVDLPFLPDVHVAFAHPALCTTCLDAASAGDPAVLTSRAGGRWRADVLRDFVRLVLASAGHSVPPSPPSPFKAPAAPLSRADLQTWLQLEPRTYGKGVGRIVVRGRIESNDESGSVDIAVYRDGPRYRLEDEHGPRLLSDGVTAWGRHHDGELGMVASPYSEPGGGPSWMALAFHRSRHDVGLFGFGAPIGPIEATQFLGRPAHRFAFAAPAHKPADMQVVIDAETGLTLEQRFGDWSLARWTEFECGGVVDPTLFGWHGPTVDLAAVRAEQDREHAADLAERESWFADHVATNLTVAGESVEVMLHEWDEDGAFDASLRGCESDLFASMSRRPRADSQWSLGWQDVTNRWSDERWDWALQVIPRSEPAPLSDTELAELRGQLDS